MPDMTPVANTIIPPNPSQGINTLSGILGLQQQRQALQTGAYQQQAVQAEAQQAQQKNQELQALAQFSSQAAKDPQYLNSDGSLNIQKFQSDAMKRAPVYGAAYVGQATTNANASVENRKALLGLTNEQRSTAANIMGAVAAKPNATYDDMQDAITQMSDISSDPGYKKMLAGMTMHVPDTRGLSDAQASAAIRSYARTMALSANAPNASQSETPVTMVQTKQGVVPVSTSPQSPLGTGPVGQPTPNVAPPGYVTPPGGIPTAVGPGGSSPHQVQSPSVPGPAPTDQDMQNFQGYQQNLNARVALGTDAQARIQQTENALQAIRSGAGSSTRASIAKTLQALGAPQGLVDSVAGGDLGKTQEAEKFLFQTTLQGLRQSMQGDPARVAEFNEANKVFPDIDTDPRAKATIMNFITQQSERDYAEQQALNTARKNGTLNPATWQADYQQQLRAGRIPGTPASQIPQTVSEERGTAKSGRPIVKRDGKWIYAD